MRGDAVRPPTIVAATIVDESGTPRYHVLPSRLVMFGLLSMGLLLVIAMILGFLVIRNRNDIEDLRDKIKVVGGPNE